jgi:hypothetical protein
MSLSTDGITRYCPRCGWTARNRTKLNERQVVALERIADALEQLAAEPRMQLVEKWRRVNLPPAYDVEGVESEQISGESWQIGSEHLDNWEREE